MLMEEKEEGAASWMRRTRERGRESDKIAFLGNEDGHHGNCS